MCDKLLVIDSHIVSMYISINILCFVFKYSCVVAPQFNFRYAYNTLVVNKGRGI